jgi:hypothetical protein
MSSTPTITTATADAASTTAAKPAGVVDGAVLYAAYRVHGGSFTYNLTAPAGWTRIQTAPASGSSVAAAALFRKVITSAAGEPANYTFSSNLSGRSTLEIVCIPDADATGTYEVSSTFFSSTGAGTVPAESVNPTFAPSTLLAFWGISSKITGWTPPGTMAEIADHSQGGSGPASNGSSSSVAWQALTATGSTGSRTATAPETNQPRTAFLVAVKIASGPTNTEFTANPAAHAQTAGASAATQAHALTAAAGAHAQTAGASAMLLAPAAITDLDAALIAGPGVRLTWTLPEGATGVRIYREEI